MLVEMFKVALEKVGKWDVKVTSILPRPPVDPLLLLLPSKRHPNIHEI